MLKNAMKLLKDEEGATAVEYGLIVAAIAGVIIAVVFLLGNKVKNQFNNVQAPCNRGAGRTAGIVASQRWAYRSPGSRRWVSGWPSRSSATCGRRRIPNTVSSSLLIAA